MAIRFLTACDFHRKSMYPLLMIWIITEVLLIVAGAFAFNRYLRKGVDSALEPPDPLNEMYRWDESRVIQAKQRPSLIPDPKNLPKP